jgi:arylsulfatase B
MPADRKPSARPFVPATARHVALLAALLATAWMPAAEPANARPNVIIILADDLGYHDLGCQGSTDIPTPNLDLLARSGVRCTAGYVTWPACGPSRASLITGRDSHRYGFYTNPTPVLARDQGLPPGVMTVPRAMQAQGYVTGGIGKWHLGTSTDRHPNQMGFSEWFGFLGGGHDYFPWSHYGKALPKRPWPEWFVNGTLPILRNDQPVTHDRYMTDLVSDEAAAFIGRHRATPFFLFLAYNAPHSPYEAPADEEQRYDPAHMEAIDGIPPALRRTYAAMVSRMDTGIGRVLQALRDHRLEERTLVCFLSDNGGGRNSENGKPGYPSSNQPLRGWKGSLWEGGIRVPFIVSWKGVLPAGTVYDHPVSALDLGATACALAGVPSSSIALDGVDLIPFWNGTRSDPPHQHLYWKLFGQGAIREGRYKLIINGGKQPAELYDLSTDTSETRNLAAEQPAEVQRLRTLWEAWNREMPPPAWKAPPEEEWTRPEYQPPLWPAEQRP